MVGRFNTLLPRARRGRGRNWKKRSEKLNCAGLGESLGGEVPTLASNAANSIREPDRTLAAQIHEHERIRDNCLGKVALQPEMICSTSFHHARFRRKVIGDRHPTFSARSQTEAAAVIVHLGENLLAHTMLPRH